MKRIWSLGFILLCLQSPAQTKSSGMDNFVFDFEKDFTPSQVDSLQALLKDHYKKTGDEIVILTADTLVADGIEFASHFAVGKDLGKGNTVNSMVFFLTEKGHLFQMIPNKKIQSVLTQKVLNEIRDSGSGYALLKKHQYFEGMWAFCKSTIDRLENPEANSQSDIPAR